MDGEAPGVQITYDANGGYFDNDPSKTTELITYQIEGSTETKIAKTSNISDDGIQSGGYGDNVSDNVDCCICCILVFKAKHRIKTESHMCLV